MYKAILSFLLIGCFSALAVAHTTDERLDLADFASNPDAFAGRTIEVSARVIAINADGKSLELFDSNSNTAITVRLKQLRKEQRVALMRSDVRRVTVSGRASVVAGRLTIDAQTAEPSSDTKDVRR